MNFLKTLPNWLNIFGLVTVVLILIPNIIYAINSKEPLKEFNNKTISVIEQIGRYASMFFMIFNIGIFEFDFSSSKNFVLYLIFSATLIFLYLIFWLPYAKKRSLWSALILAIIPSLIFLLNGIFSSHYLLILSGILFSFGHIFITYKTHR